MAQEYFNLEKTAEMLGLAPADVLKLREQNKMHGYRDGANWKFKAEDVQDKLAELIRSRGSSKEDDPVDEEGEDVLLSEIELGDSPGDTGSVIRPGEQASSDLRLASSDVDLDADDFQVADDVDMDATVADDREQVDQDATVADDGDAMADLDLMLDDDATLEDSQVASEPPEKTGSGSSIDLSEALDDDNLVLGGSSSSGSDITIGGDSGISLVDPADSGLSLEEPVDLIDAGDESLELGEDDMLVFGEEADTESPTELKTDDDFLLTPMTDGEEDEESESGSQVIALDTESEEDEAATMVGGGGGMPPMLDEDFAAEGIPDVGGAPGVVPVGAAATPMVQGPMDTGLVAGLPEAPYSMWNVLSLTFCVILLSLTGMMLYDLLRNMWSWDGSYTVNSSLMDMICNLLP